MITKKASKRSAIQWFLLPVIFSVIGLGWRYTWLGFVVPLVMLSGIVGAFSNGRYICGNFCPRGAFFDRLVVHISPKRKIPLIFRNIFLRLVTLALLISFMVYRISRNPHSLTHWGHVFWFMCVVTTVVGVFLATIIRARTWCAFCPVGTLGNLIGRKKTKSSLGLDVEKCLGCKLCEKACPMNLQIISKDKGLLVNNDCIRCWECVYSCRRRALYVE